MKRSMFTITLLYFFFQAEDGIRDWSVTGVQTCALPILGGVQQDLIPPAITLSFTQDTQQIASGLSFSVTASDNLGLKDIRLTYSDPTIGTSDSVFTSTVTNYNQSVTVTFPPGSGAGGPITLIR